MSHTTDEAATPLRTDPGRILIRVSLPDGSFIGTGFTPPKDGAALVADIDHALASVKRHLLERYGL
jgi:hypothetical protein